MYLNAFVYLSMFFNTFGAFQYVLCKCVIEGLTITRQLMFRILSTSIEPVRTYTFENYTTLLSNILNYYDYYIYLLYTYSVNISFYF